MKNVNNASSAPRVAALEPHASRELALSQREKLWVGDLTLAQFLQVRQEAIAYAKDSGDQMLHADLLLFGMTGLSRANRIDEARAALTSAKIIFDQSKDRSHMGRWLMAKSNLLNCEGNIAQAVMSLRQAISLLANHVDPRYHLRAMDDLAAMLIEIDLTDMALEVTAQLQNAALSCVPPSEPHRIRALTQEHEARFERLCSRFKPYAVPADDTEAITLRHDMEILLEQGFVNAPNNLNRYLEHTTYIKLLLNVGLNQQAAKAWEEAPASWRLDPHLPALTTQIDALISLFCKEDIVTAVVLLRRLCEVEHLGDPVLPIENLHALSYAYLKSGDYESAYEAKSREHDVRMKLATQNAKTQAALLKDELQAEREKLQTQRALVRAGKLVAVGQLASSLAHEINQPASTLVLLANQIQSDLDAHRWDDLAETVEGIRNQTGRLSQLAGRLRNFARDDEISTQLVSVKQLVEEAEALYMPKIKQLRVHYIAEVPNLYVKADKDRFSLALLNVVTNALDAMDEQLEPPSQISLEAALILGRNEVSIRIRDNGLGLSGEAEEKLFVPFYTTKPAGKGLGLGMTIAKEALDSMDARIQARNHPQGGVEVTIVLKAAVQANSGFIPS
jgi:signal transduction histidine kinase